MPSKSLSTCPVISVHVWLKGGFNLWPMIDGTRTVDMSTVSLIPLHVEVADGLLMPVLCGVCAQPFESLRTVGACMRLRCACIVYCNPSRGSHISLSELLSIPRVPATNQNMHAGISVLLADSDQNNHVMSPYISQHLFFCVIHPYLLNHLLAWSVRICECLISLFQEQAKRAASHQQVTSHDSLRHLETI